MPGPVSVTAADTPARPSFWHGHALMVICPLGGVASTAFIRRLMKTCWSRPGSPATSRKSSGMFVVTEIPRLRTTCSSNGSSRLINTSTGTR